MWNPCLREQLLDESDADGDGAAEVEVPTLGPELEGEISRWELDEYPEETSEERVLRISIQDRVDNVVIAAFGLVVAISVMSSAISMLVLDITVTEILFTLSFISGPLVMYQRLKLSKLNSIREAIAKLWTDVVSLKQSNAGLEASLNAKEKEVQTMKSTLSRYNQMIKGYDLAGITDMYHENEKIVEQKKLLAEAIGILKLRQSILSTDVDKDHWVGDAELTLLATRIEINEGIPFTSQELCDRFKREETRTLRNLADVCQALYIEKRQEQATLIAAEMLEKSPRNLGTPMLWKRKIDGIGISV